VIDTIPCRTSERHSSMKWDLYGTAIKPLGTITVSNWKPSFTPLVISRSHHRRTMPSTPLCPSGASISAASTATLCRAPVTLLLRTIAFKSSKRLALNGIPATWRAQVVLQALLHRDCFEQSFLLLQSLALSFHFCNHHTLFPFTNKSTHSIYS
jgi:hypothetical protein